MISVEQRILTALRIGHMTCSELAKALDIESIYVLRRIAMLEHHSYIKTSGWGNRHRKGGRQPLKYCLTKDGREWSDLLVGCHE